MLGDLHCCIAVIATFSTIEIHSVRMDIFSYVIRD